MKIFGVEDLYKKLFFPELESRRIEKDYSNTTNITLCSKCGGACCKMCGCHFSPDDFEDLSFEGLKKELLKGYISIDYVDEEIIYSDIGVYILRTRNQGAPIVDMGFRNDTPCILLTEEGCKLDYEKRPTGGKLLIPDSNFKCFSRYNIRDCCYEWKPYKNVLYKLTEFFEKKDISCSL